MKVLFAIINLILLAFVVYSYWKSQKVNTIRPFYWPALFTKVAAGIGLGLIYLHYYKIPSDTFLFFEDSRKLTELARTDLFSYLHFLLFGDESHPLWDEIVYYQSRALFMVKITSLFGLLTYDNYWLIGVYFSILSFFGAWRFTSVVVESFPLTRVGMVGGFLFFPSVVFWSSGLIKESIAIAALFFLSAAVVRIWVGERLPWWEWVLVIVAAWLEWRLKYYYLAVFLPIAAAALITRRLSIAWHMKSNLAKLSVWSATFIVPLAIMSAVRPNFYPTRILDVIVSTNREFVSISDPEDLIEYRSLEPTVGSLLMNTPRAIVSGIFRPFPWEAKTIFQWLIALENLLLLVLVITSSDNFVKMTKSGQRLLLFSILFFVLILCAFLALSTPNFGTLSRYRISFIPYFFLLITIENPVVRKLSLMAQRS